MKQLDLGEREPMNRSAEALFSVIGWRQRLRRSHLPSAGLHLPFSCKELAEESLSSIRRENIKEARVDW